MLKKTILSVLAGIIVCPALFAQETDYKEAFFDYQLPPTLPQYSSYTSFDVAVLTTQPPSETKSISFNLPYQVKLGNLQQVDSTGDFHVVGLLQRYGGTITSASTATVKIGLGITVYNKYGTIINTADFNNDNFAVNFGRDLSKEERSNNDLVRRLIMEKALEAGLQGFSGALYGAKLRPSVKVASLDGVKKKPELQEFDVQQKALVTAVTTQGLAGFKTTAIPFVPYWEKMAAYSGEGDANEVKRSAYHNLAVYHIAAGNIEKAKEYIELYKPIDKTIKAMFGLIKTRNSEECEKLIATLFPAAGEQAAIAEGKVWSKSEVVDDFHYLTVNGTVKIDTKKDAGTYNGLIKVNKIPSGSFGNIASLDPENILVTIHTKDANQQPKTIETTVSKVEELKDNNGTSYVTQKFGTSVLGDGSYYAFMRSTYTSPKITVYRTVLPAGSSDYVVRKAGDDKGVKSSMLNARKDLEQYVNDCAPLAEKIK
ncbi:MAG TPA: hypothetical protein VJU78_12180, partial [Chitinophagaceae bacterium]|nr:hypothetical protein [Chitinophagaceae bacterium]